MFMLYNILAYQAAWFGCVLGAANEVAWVGTALALALTAVHLVLTDHRRADLQLIAAAAALGFIVDSGLALSGQIGFGAGVWMEGWAPYWMTALWGAFATTLRHSMRWVMGRRGVAVILGAVGGPIAYFAGVRLGALQIATPEIALPLIAIAWAAAMWVLSDVLARVQSHIGPSPSPPGNRGTRGPHTSDEIIA